MSTLQAENLTYRVDSKLIVSEVCFQASSGEFLAVVGVNGAGKSTLLDLLAGLKRPTSGRILVDGKAFQNFTPSERASWICHLPQAVRADLPFTVEQIVRMGRYPRGDSWMESAADAAAVEAAMQRARCFEFRHRRFATLSGGERQRVLLAACLAQAARILLLDEPATYLDLGHQILCFELLRAEAHNGALCFAVTHDLNLALAHCDRLLVLDQGKLTADMTVAEAWSEPSWMSNFSERLRICRSPEGERWIGYG
ncbi:MAG: ABC transporter ATP-binding protein [Bryobacteraceae bacterium]|nr:ABC transporter ATP-binding protein [Bryobacteraceae bacterium]MDW8377656.1 ABC transporter ATP-binding protein [Bryobacterales bacterium]